jgi:spermidine/putrescine transport system substrate-binding protein
VPNRPAPTRTRLTAPGPSRRQFITRSTLLTGGVLLGPTLLSACGDDDESSSGGGGGDTVRVSNWPLYISEDFNADFTDATGIEVDYQENFQDNETWFAANKDALAAEQDIGADLVVPTNFMAARLIGLEWLDELDKDNIPNWTNIRDDLKDGPWDPGAVYSLPYMSGFVGLAYNEAATGRPITSIDDLWDPAFEGKVSLFSDFQDALGMIMMSQGNSPAEPTVEAVQEAADLVAEYNDQGQIRRFTGNDYADDLTSGNVVICQAYSGDVVQLQADNPDLKFVVPDTGCTQFVDTMVIPYTTQNKAAAEEWMNFVYDRANYAKLIEYVQYIPVLSDMTEELEALDPALAEDPLINPPQEVLDRVESWAILDEETESEMITIYTDVTGG